MTESIDKYGNALKRLKSHTERTTGNLETGNPETRNQA